MIIFLIFLVPLASQYKQFLNQEVLSNDDPNNVFLSNHLPDPNDMKQENQQKLVIFINSINNKKKRLIGDHFIQQIEITPETTNPDDKFFFLDIDDANSSSEFREVLEPYNYSIQYDEDNIHISKIFWDINVNKNESYWDPYKLIFQDGDTKNYELLDYIGRGTFSEVHLGKSLEKNDLVIIKRIKPDRTKTINREIQILNNLKGAANIVQLIDAIRDQEQKNATLVYSYLNGTTLDNFKLQYLEIKKYIYQLFNALNETHSKGIIHRDVKPQNIVLDKQEEKLLLIDWGISEFYHPMKQYSTIMGTRHYRAPELLVHYLYYDYAIDVWAGGCILAELIFLKHPFFHGEDNSDQLYKIVKVLGSEKFEEFLSKYDVSLYSKQLHEKLKNLNGKEWKEFITEQNKHLCQLEAIQLLNQILVYDYVMQSFIILQLLENQTYS